jgi:putative transcriptional regulator
MVFQEGGSDSSFLADASLLKDATMQSLQGFFLVAAPRLAESNFYHTVVLMVSHDAKGALGLVLTRPSNSPIGEVWEQLTEEECDHHDPIYIGGPVEGPLMAVHQEPDCSEQEIVQGVHFTTDRDHLGQILGQHERPFRIFSGYSGWSAGQLERELKAGGWLTVPATVDWIFSDDDELWKEVSQAIGLELLQRTLRPKHVPEDASAN